MGVECSLDNPNTHRKTGAMSEREVTFEERAVRCEGHTKLEPHHRSRVHFEVSGAEVLVGIFADHLST